ncbi:hypothetical protein OGAPHI_004219 [Ogataea philodendri]|uniref:Uncharacterized protein n=1 Tax=Ogataea philodendri TaxID=1378263 RepID=A0A9P8P6B3_9ASCO|nr:uncharacterized protein OGAPHI_004219 [Ogataea philodendri]KAH3666030.1 hypothetical protein OGAPHI_004219 [Ogataea philodendri]
MNAEFGFSGAKNWENGLFSQIIGFMDKALWSAALLTFKPLNTPQTVDAVRKGSVAPLPVVPNFVESRYLVAPVISAVAADHSKMSIKIQTTRNR